MKCEFCLNNGFFFLIYGLLPGLLMVDYNNFQQLMKKMLKLNNVSIDRNCQIKG